MVLILQMRAHSRSVTSKLPFEGMPALATKTPTVQSGACACERQIDLQSAGLGSSPVRRTRAVLELRLDDDPAQVELRAAVCTHGDSHVLRKRCGQRLGDSHVEVHHNHLAGTLRGEASAQRGTYPVGAARHDDDFASRRELRHGRAVDLGEQHQTGWGSPL